MVTDETCFDDGNSATTVRLFSDERHRERYIADRGWGESRARWRAGRLANLRSRVEATYRGGGIEIVERDDLIARIRAFEASATTNALSPQ